MAEVLRMARMLSREGPLAPGPQFLMIVAEAHAKLYPRVRIQFLDDPRVEVILDRRRSQRRRETCTHSPERRRGERRHTPDYWEDLRYHPVVLIPPASRRAVADHVHSTPTSWAAGGAMDASEGLGQVRQQIDQLRRWLVAGQELLGDVVPELAQTVEDEHRRREDLARELDRREGELGRLRAEVERLARERTATADAIGAAVREIEELTRRAAEKLRGYTGLLRS